MHQLVLLWDYDVSPAAQIKVGPCYMLDIERLSYTLAGRHLRWHAPHKLNTDLHRRKLIELT
jgi:hypothetical protein